jgi:hypothetical protein
MLKNLYRKLEPKATWAIFTILLIVFFIFGQVFEMRKKDLGEGICYQKTESWKWKKDYNVCNGEVRQKEPDKCQCYQTFDMRLPYSPDEMSLLFANLKNNKTKTFSFITENRLNLYAISEITLDFVFPFIYCFLIIILIIRLWSAETAKYLILLPVIAGISDLCENTTIALLAFAFNENSSSFSFAYLAASFTAIKIILLIICVLIVVPVGAIISIKKRRTQKEI